MKQRLIIFSVIMGSYLGFFLVFPLFPTIFLNESYHFLPTGTSSAVRNILLGLTYTIYYAGSFIGTPWIGRLSDRLGRKPILCISLFIPALMYVLSACAIFYSSLPLLLVARFCTGLFDSSFSLAYTSLMDTEKSGKLNNIEFWATTATNIGWILGSFIGWSLIAHASLSITFLAMSFLCACAIYLISFTLVFLFFTESKAPSPIDPVNPFFVVLNSFKRSPLRPILISNTSFYAAASIFLTYLPIFLIGHYHFTPDRIGAADSCLSFSACLAPFTYWLYSKYFSRQNTMCISACGVAISLTLLILSPFKLPP